jgi:Mn-dependent DtxR family transcriptional regulator
MKKKKGNSSEDYLKAILNLQKSGKNVRAVDIADALDVTKPSVSVALKKLKAKEMICQDANGFIGLTEKGSTLAVKTTNKHRIITKLLTGIGVNNKTAAEEACLIEHAIGEETYERMEEYCKNNNM